VILFRHADPRFPFLWETASQPPARWHGPGEGPVHYLADTPDGAWAELLRHEEIRDLEDLAGIRRAIWAIEVPDPPATSAGLPATDLLGDAGTYPSCRQEAARLRDSGLPGFRTISAALLPGDARGWIVQDGLRPGADRDGVVFVLFGRRPDLLGWPVTLTGQPPDYLLSRVRHALEETLQP
jgi:hypothetical protein